MLFVPIDSRLPKLNVAGSIPVSRSNLFRLYAETAPELFA